MDGSGLNENDQHSNDQQYMWLGADDDLAADLDLLLEDLSGLPDLPDKIESQVDCRLTHEQASLYQAVVDEMLERIEVSEGIERRGIVLTTMLRLKQVHPQAQLSFCLNPL